LVFDGVAQHRHQCRQHHSFPFRGLQDFLLFQYATLDLLEAHIKRLETHRRPGSDRACPSLVENLPTTSLLWQIHILTIPFPLRISVLFRSDKYNKKETHPL
jgi:hypothetical protein